MKVLQILKQLLYKLVYKRKLILIINYEKYEGIIIKRLLEIIEKIL